MDMPKEWSLVTHDTCIKAQQLQKERASARFEKKIHNIFEPYSDLHST